MSGGKKSKSQWDFGELFPPEQTRRVLSVSELTEQVRRLLELHIGLIWVTGEITNLRTQSSGHTYFTLKDANAQLSCVLFRSATVAHRQLLTDGQKVLLQGDVTVYEARGQYQLIVRAVELQGVGALQVAFEKLKQKLAAEGLFAPERKRPLPRFPQRLGLVTSPTGAAIRDVLHVIQRRNPSLEIILAPCRVQGEKSSEEIAEAIRRLNEIGPPHVPLDLILVTRGGGSLEDLWAFNEEIVARAIFESALPVVSAVGHEIDFTISDFVADVRAATPSAAAEVITEDVFASREFVAEAPSLMATRVRQQLRRATKDFTQLAQRLHRAHPRRLVNEWLQRLDELHTDLIRNTRQRVRERSVAWQNATARLWRTRPAQLVKDRTQMLTQARRRLGEQARHELRERFHAWQTLDSRLRLLGPEQVLARGYSITMDAASGNVLRDATKVKSGQRLKTRLQQGEVLSKVEK
ncbi:MAG: exodeoxyribonuclease VII large subunit [Verrucomicrobiae bacterium]|nr:exodeoxyribonuclease VII large subunit [Verrucomicrobiae bacterium]